MFWGPQTLYIYLLKGAIAHIYMCKKDDKAQCIDHPGISLLLTTEFNLGLLKTILGVSYSRGLISYISKPRLNSDFK
jgi:hypothetical protein